MASNQAAGFKPWGPIYRSDNYTVRGIDNARVFRGDVVDIPAADGYVSAAAVASTACIGISLQFLTGAVTGSVLVADDPSQPFESVYDDNTSVVTDVGLTGRHAAGAGSLVTELSGHKLDGSTFDVGATNTTFKIRKFLTTNPGDVAFAATGTRAVALFTTHAFRTNTGH